MGVRRPELVVAAAIAVSLPMLPSFVDGGIGVAALAVRFGIALALCWAAGALVERVYDTYARKARAGEIDKALRDAYRQPGQEDHDATVDRPAHGPHALPSTARSNGAAPPRPGSRREAR